VRRRHPERAPKASSPKQKEKVPEEGTLSSNNGRRYRSSVFFFGENRLVMKGQPLKLLLLLTSWFGSSKRRPEKIIDS
jgi:hypothetical protein